VVGSVGHIAPHDVLHPPPEVLVDGTATGPAEDACFGPGHPLLELLEGLLLGADVDVAYARSRSRRSLKLPDPTPVALAPVDASFSVDPLLGFLYYGLAPLLGYWGIPNTREARAM
jgi:hypothetical protein